MERDLYPDRCTCPLNPSVCHIPQCQLPCRCSTHLTAAVNCIGRKCKKNNKIKEQDSWLCKQVRIRSGRSTEFASQYHTFIVWFSGMNNNISGAEEQLEAPSSQHISSWLMHLPRLSTLSILNKKLWENTGKVQRPSQQTWPAPHHTDGSRIRMTRIKVEEGEEENHNAKKKRERERAEWEG